MTKDFRNFLFFSHCFSANPCRQSAAKLKLPPACYPIQQLNTFKSFWRELREIEFKRNERDGTLQPAQDIHFVSFNTNFDKERDAIGIDQLLESNGINLPLFRET